MNPYSILRKLKSIIDSISKNSSEDVNLKYYVNVSELMKQELPRPKLKSKFIMNGDEILPIITVTVGVWEW